MPKPSPRNSPAIARTQASAGKRNERKTSSAKPSHNKSERKKSLIEELEAAIANHQTGEVIRALDAWKERKKRLKSTSLSETARLLRSAAQWVEVDPSQYRWVSDELDGLEKSIEDKNALPVRTFLDIIFARSLITYHNNKYDQALSYLHNAEAMAIYVEDRLIQSYIYYCIGKCLWRSIQYQDAIPYIEKAIEYGENEFAVIGPLLLKAWLLFLTKDYSQSKEVLDQLRPKLAKADDCYNTANMLSIEGRLAQIRGDYAAAIKNFEESVEEYKCYERVHPNIARSYVNMAFVYLWNGLDEGEHKSKGRGSGRNPKFNKTIELLSKAEKIYNESYEAYGKPQTRGLARLKAIRSYAYHYSWQDRKKALKEAEEAFKEVEKFQEYTVMAMAKIGESMIHMSIESLNAQSAAYKAAKRAIAYAKETENEHLQAHAYLEMGWVFTEGVYKNPKKAAKCGIKVEKFLGETDKKYYLWKELEELKDKIDEIQTAKKPIISFEAHQLEEKSLKIIMLEVAQKVCRHMWDIKQGNVNKMKDALGTGPAQINAHLDGSRLDEAWEEWNKRLGR